MTVPNECQPVPVVNLLGTSPVTTPADEVHDIVVGLRVDGRSYLATLRLDTGEHGRRQALGLGSATSAGLLHALWNLPRGIPVPSRTLTAQDSETLRREGVGWVGESQGTFVRNYEPPGIIHAILVADTLLGRALGRVAAHPPTVRRTVLWVTSARKQSGRMSISLDRARNLGIGVLAVANGCATELVQPAEATQGRPCVFRWWQAELAYRNWLKSTVPTAKVGASA
jgi:hypothetical protein